MVILFGNNRPLLCIKISPRVDRPYVAVYTAFVLSSFHSARSVHWLSDRDVSASIHPVLRRQLHGLPKVDAFPFTMDCKGDGRIIFSSNEKK